MAMLSTPDTARRIPVKPVPVSQMKARLRRRIRLYERRYEIPTSRMLEEVEQGQMRETVEILRWMYDYRVLELLEPAIRTGGTRSTTTAPSTRNGSKSITS